MSIYDEPDPKRVHAFFDCQNLFRTAKNIWQSHTYPDYDPVALARTIVKQNSGWNLMGIHLYTGIHAFEHNEHWHNFWTRKLEAHKKQDSRVTVFTRLLRYSSIPDKNDGQLLYSQPREKGIDVRIALDLVRRARLGEYDVALLFSQDDDFKEVAEEVRAIARERQCWIKIVSAFPSDGSRRCRGVDKTDWMPFDEALYNSCRDAGKYV